MGVHCMCACAHICIFILLAFAHTQEKIGRFRATNVIHPLSSATPFHLDFQMKVDMLVNMEALSAESHLLLPTFPSSA